MSNNFENIWFLEIAELQRQSESANMQYSELVEKFDQISSVLKGKKQKQFEQNKEFIINQRVIKDSRNYFFQMNNKLLDIDETFRMLDDKIESKRNELSGLDAEKYELEKVIRKFLKSMKDNPEKFASLEKEYRVNIKKIDKLKKKKRALLDEISRFLSKTTTEREDFEKKTEEMSKDFLNILSKRISKNNELAESSGRVQEIKDEIQEVESQIETIKEIEKLDSKSPVTKDELTSLTEAYQKLLVIEDPKKVQLELLYAENEELRKQISPIETDEVIKYDEASSALNSAREKFISIRDQHQQGLEKILELMLEKTGLEKSPGMLLEMVGSLEKRISDLEKDDIG